MQPGTVTGITPGFVISFGEGASDPGDWGIVIKWDVIDGTDPITMGEEFLFSFTLPETYAFAPTTFFAKAGGDNNQGLIFGPSCLIAEPSIDVEKTCSDDVFVGDWIAYEITVTNTGNVALSSVTVSDPIAGINELIDSLEPGASETFLASIPTTAAGQITNTVSASGEYFGNVVRDEDSCVTTIWQLAVAKTADASYNRNWNWTLEKSVEDSVATQQRYSAE